MSLGVIADVVEAHGLDDIGCMGRVEAYEKYKNLCILQNVKPLSKRIFLEDLGTLHDNITWDEDQAYE